ncbi:MAG: hypothetical protein E7047_01215 [Lentisphaerae bacterium]|nr:hypothetical protein [Lentisphaerota bacterium]
MKKFWSITACVLLTVLQCAGAPAKAKVDFTLDLADHGKLMQGTVKVPRSIPGKNIFCELSIIPAGKKVAEDQRITLNKWKVPANRTLVFKQQLALPERTRYVARIRVLNKSGKQLAAADTAFATPPEPNWQGFTGGMPDGTVPAPWTRVERSGNEVSVWGRKFVFTDSPLPEQLFSQDQELLQGRSRLLLDPAPEKWVLKEWQDVDDTTVRSIWEGQINGQNAYRAVVDVYFDGVVRFDLELPEGMTVKRFALEFPVKKSVARTLHRGPWGFGGYKTSYHVKPTPDYHPIRPQLFLYNNNIGFGWFDGMEFDWPLAKPNRALEVLPQENAVLFRVNYIDKTTHLKQKRVYSCGLQPLPVRPLPQQEKGLRMCYAFNYTAVDTTAWKGTVDYLPKGNILTDKGTAEMSVRFDFDPKTHKKEEFFFETTHGPLHFRYGWSPHYGIFAQVYERYQSRAIVATKLNPEPGKWIHMALTWGNELAVYMDGKKVGSTPWKGSSAAFPAMIHAGGVNVAVDGFRISDIARQKFVIDRAPEADEHTLLLDNFEKSIYCNGRRATAPEKISDFAEAGYLTPDANLGEGRWGQGVMPMTAEPRNLIAGLRHYKIDTFCFHASQYTDESMAGMYIAEPERMRRIVDEIHNHGGRAVIYINNSLSNLDRAWDTHKNDWLITPKGHPFIAAIRPHEKSYQACPRSDYINYFFWRLDALFKDYQLDGAFLDGRMYSKCDNALHGCGVVNFEGKRVPQRNVWDGRMKAWRLYNIIESNGGYGEQHKSSIWDAPTCFFWDAAWEGEQFMLQTVKPGQKKLDMLPLEAMHEHINGRVYGLPSRYTAYLEQPFSAVENCTYSFVHGTTWTMTYRIHEAAFTAPYWHALDNFGADNWNFRGYWEATPPAAAVPDELVKVSAHVKEDSALAIIANFNEDKPFVEGKIRFQWDKLGLTGPFRAYDAFSGEEIPVNGQEIEIKIKSFRQSWIIFEKIAQ